MSKTENKTDNKVTAPLGYNIRTGKWDIDMHLSAKLMDVHDEAYKEGYEEGRKIGKVCHLIKMGKTDAEIIALMTKEYEISEEQVEEYLLEAKETL